MISGCVGRRLLRATQCPPSQRSAAPLIRVPAPPRPRPAPEGNFFLRQPRSRRAPASSGCCRGPAHTSRRELSGSAPIGSQPEPASSAMRAVVGQTLTRSLATKAIVAYRATESRVRRLPPRAHRCRDPWLAGRALLGSHSSASSQAPPASCARSGLTPMNTPSLSPEQPQNKAHLAASALVRKHQRQRLGCARAPLMPRASTAVDRTA